MSKPLRSIIFAMVLCLVCSVLLTAASSGLKERQMRNMAVDRQKNILMAAGLITGPKQLTTHDIESVYKENIKNLWVSADGSIVSAAERGETDLPVYVNYREGRIIAYVIPIDTRGLWGKIHGYLAIEKDGTTIRGFSVYKHSETPGLGGEIESRWFRKNFEGKKITDHEGAFVSISVAKGAVEDAVPVPRQNNYVDGISGATLTGKYLTSGLKDILRDYEPVAVRFRKNMNIKEDTE
ncbi:MAG: FMN-binding protein [Desulfobacteraceae bacterium]|nr:FMN-binding protein [Desulfobacteraceae bacterium]